MSDLNLTPKEIDELITADRSRYSEKPDFLCKYRAYLDGRQDIVLTEEQAAILGVSAQEEYCDNICHQINSEDADRVIFEGWETPSQKEQEWLSELFTQNQMDDFAGDTHYATFGDGNYTVRIDHDDEQKRIVFAAEDWWNGKKGMFVAYDDDGNKKYAVKEWENQDKHLRRVVWFEDRIYRFIQSKSGGKWEPFLLPEDDGEWPVRWLKVKGDPLHIPVIHFINGGRRARTYGLSELAGGVIGLQNDINRLQLSISATAFLTGFQQMWISGYKDAVDEDGNPVDLIVQGGTVWKLPSPDSRAGVIPAGDIGQMIAAYDKKVQSVARMTRTPAFIITGGDWPSGQALGKALRPLIDKTRRQSNKVAPSWVELAHRSMEIANARWGLNLNEDSRTAPIKAKMRDTSGLDMLEDAQAIKELGDAAGSWVNAGMSLPFFLQKFKAWNQEQADELQDDIDEQDRRQRQADAANVRAIAARAAAEDVAA